MHRRSLLGLITAAATGIPGRILAQAPASIPRVGVLYTVAPSVAYNELVPALARLGFKDGANVVLEPRSAASNPQSLGGLTAELISRNVTALVAVGPAAVSATVAATRTIPIIAIDLESDPVQRKWAQSLARPGGNLTGFFMDLPAMAGKWIELLREAVPGLRKATLLWDTTTGNAQIEAARSAAQKFSISLELVEVRNGTELSDLLGKPQPFSRDALVVLSSPLIFGNAARIAEYATRNRIPAIAPFRPFSAAGGLMSYGPDVPAFFRLAATYVDKILRGAKPQDLPIQMPTKFDLVVNTKAARALGITIPPSVMLRAEELIE